MKGTPNDPLHITGNHNLPGTDLHALRRCRLAVLDPVRRRSPDPDGGQQRLGGVVDMEQN